VWSLIAGMAPGFHATVAQFCKMVACHPDTWRSTIKLLVRCGMVSVERSANGVKYTAVTNTSKWDIPAREDMKISHPMKNSKGMKNSHPEGMKISDGGGMKNSHPSEEHIEEQKNNNTSTTTRACERLVAELMADGRVELALMQYHITVEQYRRLVDEIINDWQFRGLPDSDYNLNHFSIVLRTVMAKQQRNNGTGQQTDGRADKDSTIAQLDRDTLTAMASLARKGQYIDKAPF
jgi:hypothetical protein